MDIDHGAVVSRSRRARPSAGNVRGGRCAALGCPVHDRYLGVMVFTSEEEYPDRKKAEGRQERRHVAARGECEILGFHERRRLLCEKCVKRNARRLFADKPITARAFQARGVSEQIPESSADHLPVLFSLIRSGQREEDSAEEAEIKVR